MQHKTEQTFLIEGLLEGPLLDGAKVSELQEWVSKARKKGFLFHLSTDARAYSLLPDNRPMPTLKAQAVDTALCSLLNDFSDNLEPEERMASVSTLRSSEFRPNLEIQTVYALEPNGNITPRQRQIEAHTVPPAKPPGLRKRIKFAGLSALFLGIAIAVTYPFIPYRELLQTFSPVEVSDITVDATAFTDVFEVKATWIEQNQLVIEVTINPLLQTPNGLDSAYFDERSLERRIALECLVRKRLHVEIRSNSKLLVRRDYPIETVDIPLLPKNTEEDPHTAPAFRKTNLIAIPLPPGTHSVKLKP